MDRGSSFIVTTASGFEAEARRELAEITPTLEARSMFFKGTLYVESDLDKGDFVEALRMAETLYIGRLFPVDAETRISVEKEGLRELINVIRGLGKLGEGEKFRVHCKRRGSHEFNSRDVEVTVGSALEEDPGAVFEQEDPAKAVVVQIFQDVAYVGVTDSGNLLVKEIKRFRKFRKGERPFTRAEFKIREALNAFEVVITEEDRVLDVGAAPGGWTKFLSGVTGSVVAVDPAGLHPSLEGVANVTHLRCRAEELPEDLGEFDLITNDMNLSPVESAEIMVNLARFLKRDGSAIMTVKFVTNDRKGHIREATEALEREYKDFKVKRLRHNRYETTVYMAKK